MHEDDIPPYARMTMSPHERARGDFDFYPDFGHDWAPPTWRDWARILVPAAIFSAILWAAVWFGFRLASAWVAPWV